MMPLYTMLTTSIDRGIKHPALEIEKSTEKYWMLMYSFSCNKEPSHSGNTDYQTKLSLKYKAYLPKQWQTSFAPLGQWTILAFEKHVDILMMS